MDGGSKKETPIKRNKEMGEKKEGEFFCFLFMRERESCIGIYYIILVGNIYYFSKYNEILTPHTDL